MCSFALSSFSLILMVSLSRSYEVSYWNIGGEDERANRSWAGAKAFCEAKGDDWDLPTVNSWGDLHKLVLTINSLPGYWTNMYFFRHGSMRGWVDMRSRQKSPFMNRYFSNHQYPDDYSCAVAYRSIGLSPALKLMNCKEFVSPVYCASYAPAVMLELPENARFWHSQIGYVTQETAKKMCHEYVCELPEVNSDADMNTIAEVSNGRDIWIGIIHDMSRGWVSVRDYRLNNYVTKYFEGKPIPYDRALCLILESEEGGENPKLAWLDCNHKVGDVVCAEFGEIDRKPMPESRGAVYRMSPMRNLVFQDNE